RKTADIDGLGNRTTYRYDSRDLLIERRDARGNVITYEYDRYGHLVTRRELIDAVTPIIVKYSYDKDENLVALSRIEVSGRVTSTAYSYDALRRRTATVLAPGTALERRYENLYDTASNLVAHTKPDGLRETRSYDALNRLIQINYDASQADRLVGGSP